MTNGRVERWQPVVGLIERPAVRFDISWHGFEQRVILTVHYATNAGENHRTASAQITFDDVLAFQVFDEYMELSGVTNDDAALLNVNYPYGGRWPYLEVHDSDWIRQMVELDGSRNAVDLRHFVITSRNTHLHVACHTLSPPKYCSAR